MALKNNVVTENKRKLIIKLDAHLVLNYSPTLHSLVSLHWSLRQAIFGLLEFCKKDIFTAETFDRE